MGNFLRSTDNHIWHRNQKERNLLRPNITKERIEKLKKHFQPFWMRGYVLHDGAENEEALHQKNF